MFTVWTDIEYVTFADEVSSAIGSHPMHRTEVAQ